MARLVATTAAGVSASSEPAIAPLIRRPSAHLRKMFGACDATASSSSPSADARRAPDYFPEWDEPEVRPYHHEPVVGDACGPRIVENFLDMADFLFVHPERTGRSHTRGGDYTVT